MQEMQKVRVRVTAGAKKERFESAGERCIIAVKEKAQRNEANERVRELVAAHFGVSVVAVRIISGHRSPHKTLAIKTDL